MPDMIILKKRKIDNYHVREFYWLYVYQAYFKNIANVFFINLLNYSIVNK